MKAGFVLTPSFAMFDTALLAKQKNMRTKINCSLNRQFINIKFFRYLVRLDNQIAIKGRDHDFHHHMRNEKYIHLAPGTSDKFDYSRNKSSKANNIRKMLLNFKKRHRDELGLFRTNISKLTKDISKDKFFFRGIETTNRGYL